MLNVYSIHACMAMRVPCLAWGMQPQRRPTPHRAAVRKLLLTAQAPKLSQDEQLEQLMARLSEYKVAMDTPLEPALLSDVVQRAQFHQVM